MVDTGSDLTLLDCKLVDNNSISELVSNSNIKLRSASGDLMVVKGKIVVPMHIGTVHFEQAVYLVQDLPCDLILGMDFLNKQKVTLKCAQKILVIQKHKFRLNSTSVSRLLKLSLLRL